MHAADPWCASMSMAFPCQSHDDMKSHNSHGVVLVIQSAHLSNWKGAESQLVCTVSVGYQTFLSTSSEKGNPAGWHQGCCLTIEDGSPSTAVVQVHQDNLKLVGRAVLPLLPLINSWPKEGKNGAEDAIATAAATTSGNPSSPTSRQDLVLDLYDAQYWDRPVGTLSVSVHNSNSPCASSLPGEMLPLLGGFATAAEALRYAASHKRQLSQRPGRQLHQQAASNSPRSMVSKGSEKQHPPSAASATGYAEADLLLHQTDPQQVSSSQPASTQPGTRSCCKSDSNSKPEPKPSSGAPRPHKKDTRHKCIQVYNRALDILEEEYVQPKLLAAMRFLYLTRPGRLLLKLGVRGFLGRMTFRKGIRMSHSKSAADIPGFLQTFHGHINLSEVAIQDLASFGSFNDFFYRALKPDARPVAAPSNAAVMVSCGDSRLSVYDSVDEAQRFWIKGRRFSLEQMLGDKDYASKFSGGSVLVFRLAPQDYHRFHTPVDGVVTEIQELPGHYYTVNPVAINVTTCNPLGDNRRAVARIQSPTFGDVAFLPVGATMVGSIVWSISPGQAVGKGQELGMFAFGGSTVVLVVQKGVLRLDEDLVARSQQSLETLVKVGERIGERAAA